MPNWLRPIGIFAYGLCLTVRVLVGIVVSTLISAWRVLAEFTTNAVAIGWDAIKPFFFKEEKHGRSRWIDN